MTVEETRNSSQRWISLPILGLLGLTLLLSSCATSDISSAGLKVPANCRSPHCYEVKATAYTHTEKDSRKYGKLTAKGSTLRGDGSIRSAAADWSRFPVGTKFRIIGLNQVFEVDDYGSALVGKDVVDIYQRSRVKMNQWGAPMVGIEVLEWGSFEESLRIMEPRTRHRHVRQMVAAIHARQRQEQNDGLRRFFPGRMFGRRGPIMSEHVAPAAIAPNPETVVVRAQPIAGWSEAPMLQPPLAGRP